MEVNIPEIISYLLKICKEYEYTKLQEAIHNSYNELIKAEAEAKRKKSSGVISCIRAIDREIISFNFEYDRIKKSFNIENIHYFDTFISGIKQQRDKLFFEHKKINRTN